MINIDDSLAYWGLLGMTAGLHLAGFTSRDRQDRKIRHLVEVQHCMLGALRDARTLLILQHPHSAKQAEFSQKVLELERMFGK